MNRSQLIERVGPLGLYAAARRLTRDHPRILMYHRFAAGGGSGRVSAAVFDQQVRYIKRHHTPMVVGDLIAHLKNGDRMPAHAIALTIDDGHADFYEVAWPVLRRHGVPASIFVATGFVDGELWLWPDQVSWLLESAQALPRELEVDGEIIPTEGEHRLWQALIERLLTMTDTDKHRVIGELAASVGLELPRQAPPAYANVTWAQLREMQAQGLEVGGHTHTHPALSRVASPRLAEEIDHCLARLDDELGVRARPFCYPNGQPSDYSAEVRDAVERAGFTGAVVAYADHARHGDRYTLRRHSSSGNMFQFHKAASGLEWLGARVRRWGRAA